ncbi:unnamed protein product, partial [Rotaria socialis]
RRRCPIDLDRAGGWWPKEKNDDDNNDHYSSPPVKRIKLGLSDDNPLSDE